MEQRRTLHHDADVPVIHLAVRTACSTSRHCRDLLQYRQHATLTLTPSRNENGEETGREMAGRARKGQRGKGKGVEEHGGEERG